VPGFRWLHLVNYFGAHGGYDMICHVLRSTTDITVFKLFYEIVSCQASHMTAVFQQSFLPKFVRLCVTSLSRIPLTTSQVREWMISLRQMGRHYDPFDLNNMLRQDLYRLPFLSAILFAGYQRLPQEIADIVYTFFYTDWKQELQKQCPKCTTYNEPNFTHCGVCNFSSIKKTTFPSTDTKSILQTFPLTDKNAELRNALMTLNRSLDQTKASDDDYVLPCINCTFLIPNPFHRKITICPICGLDPNKLP